MEAIRRTLLEKLARDAGFDRVAQLQGKWLVVGSSHFGEEVLLTADGADSATIVALADRDRSRSIGSIPGVTERANILTDGFPEPRQLWLAQSDEALAELLALVATEARARRDQPLERFHGKTKALPRNTEAERMVIARVGQDMFRDALIEYWEGRCAITGLQIVPLLRASHAKPWRLCETDAERLDVFNGFLLAPNFDAAFDGGWISFDDGGRIVVAPTLDMGSMERLGIHTSLRLTRIASDHLPYLAFHREHVFKRADT